jgi:hypothetical protein
MIVAPEEMFACSKMPLTSEAKELMVRVLSGDVGESP